MKKKLLSLLLCLTLTASAFGAVVPYAEAVDGNSTAYAFGDTNGPFRDLYAEHQQEVQQREKERKKAAKKQAVQEKAAMKKAAREARERENRDKAAKKNAEKEN